ncbi:MAG: serine hydrolase domain-containing protein [Cellulosilyticaceae bacterium]
MKRRKILIGSSMLLTAGLLLGSVYGVTASQVSTPKELSQEEDILTDYEVYGIGSVSKMFGTVAVMQLAQEGKIDLDAPLIQYIPEFEMADARYKAITPRMLLNHTSGLLGSSLHDGMLLGDTNDQYTEQVLEGLKSQRLKADPGAFSVYCNDGFTLAEILVERVSGMDFTTYIDQKIAKPLGMENTYTPVNLPDVELLAKTYYRGMETPTEAVAPLASGGIYATAADLCKFGAVFMKGEETLLTEASKEEMAKAWHLEDTIGAVEGDSTFSYGLGWDAVNTYPFNQYGIQALSKGGDTTMYHANLTVLPEEKMSIAVVASGGASSQCQLAAQEILLEVLKEEGIIEAIKEEKAFEKKEKVAIPESMKKYAGVYQAKEMVEVSFTAEDTMEIQALEGDVRSNQSYHYTSEGNFVSADGQYISGGGLSAGADGTKGITYLNFREEANGETYLLGSTYESVSGLGKTAMTIPMAQKMTPHKVADSVMKVWEERDGKKYYNIGERASGTYYLNMPYVEMGLLEEVPGYTKTTKGIMNTRIVDADHARNEVQLPGVLGRDLKDLSFYREAGVEYLQCNDLLFVAEDGIATTKELQGSCTIDESGYTKWYQVAKEDVGKEVVITVPQGSAYYVYNEDGGCITSSIFKGSSRSVILPKDGSIALVGPVGAKFAIEAIK